MSKGFQYDFYAEEWSYECGACGTAFYAPTKNDMKYIWNRHIDISRDDCLGGW